MISSAVAPSFSAANTLLRLLTSNAACVAAAPLPGTRAARPSARVFGTHEAIATPTSPVAASTPTTDHVVMSSVVPPIRAGATLRVAHGAWEQAARGRTSRRTNGRTSWRIDARMARLGYERLSTILSRTGG